jgi:predicted metal-dependent hydrolase
MVVYIEIIHETHHTKRANISVNLKNKRSCLCTADMLNFVQGAIIVLIVIILYKYVEYRSYDVVYVTASVVPHRQYLVRNLPDKQAAADLMAYMSSKLEKLVELIKNTTAAELFTKYISQDIHAELATQLDGNNSDSSSDSSSDSAAQQLTDKEIEEGVRTRFYDDRLRLLRNFNPNNFSENTPDSKYTSYSVNKGEKIIFCLRNKNAGESLVAPNVMVFVSIHELGHLMTKSIGHGPDFWLNFKILLKIAVDNNIYKEQNFKKKPEEYCGTTITDTPLNK